MSNAETKAVENAWLPELKVGDHVFVGKEQYGKKSAQVLTVESRTKTLIRVKRGTGHVSEFKLRYSEWNNSWAAYSHPSTTWGDEIFAQATPAECEAWDAKQTAARQAAQDKEAEKQQREDKRAELRQLFAPDEATNTIYVRDGEWTEHEGLFDVTFHGLTEAEVRELAAKVKA